jgi:tellurite resistance protein
MTMGALKLRSRGDRELATKLLNDPFVKRVVEALERDEEKSPKGVRRQLLARSLRVTESMMPDLHDEVRLCRERLAIEIPLELYLYPSATFNAACIKPEEGRLFILIASSLLEAFPPGERRFVIGHELGHHLFGHHDIPIGYVLRGNERPRPELALRLFAWSRYAEISADRAGAFCTDDPDQVGRALFRLASGLTRPLDDLRIAEFAAQADELAVAQTEPGYGTPTADWFSTHPFSPLRLKALELFFESELARSDGFPIATLEARVQELMAIMEPSYLEEKSESAEAARRVLFAGSIAIANATGGISEEEQKVFEDFFGEASYSDRLDLETIEQSLDERIAEANERVSHPRRIQVVRDLCVMARASGEVSPKERAIVDDIATTLEVPPEIVEETLCRDCELD